MKIVAYIICYIIYPFSFLFKRSKNRWAFGSFRKSFNDNAKYLFIYAAEHAPNRDIAWISTSRSTVQFVRSCGLKAYNALSIKGVWHALTSKYWFFNSYTSDIMYCLSGNAVCVNLWHGVGLKRAEFNIVSGALADRYQKRSFKERFFHPESFKRPDYFLSSTPFQSSMFAKAFRIEEQNCLNLGYPRNRILTCSHSERLSFVDRYESKETLALIECCKKYNKVYIYMPTWRDSQRDLFVQNMDLGRLNRLFADREELLLLKPHANTIASETQWSNIVFVDGRSDIYPILPYTDVLITDYSSILYDYLLMDNKDVILYLYDYASYATDRDFYYPFDENVVGRKVYSFNELFECLCQVDYHIDSEQKQHILYKFWGKTAAMDSAAEILKFVELL